MARSKLLDEVSVQELLNLRESEHLSNSEIAERLGVTAPTIWRLIGPAGKEYRRPPKPRVEKPVEEDYGAGIMPCGKDEHFIASGRKKITIHNGQTVDIMQMTENGDSPIFTGLKKADVEVLVGELKAVLHRMGA